MQSLKISDLYNFNTDKVITTLNAVNPCLWNKKLNLDAVGIANIVKTSELHRLQDWEETENDEFDCNEDGIIESYIACPVTGYQDYVTELVIEWYS